MISFAANFLSDLAFTNFLIFLQGLDPQAPFMELGAAIAHAEERLGREFSAEEIKSGALRSILTPADYQAAKEVIFRLFPTFFTENSLLLGLIRRNTCALFKF